MFYKQAIIDIERKFWIMKQLSLIISPRSMQSKWTKFLPTICLLDPVSLRAWLNIRRIGLDYGRKYFYRHELFLPVTLLLMSLNIIGCFAIFLLIKMDWTESQVSRMKQLLVSMMIDSILFFFSGFHFIFLAGALNDEFRIHIRTLDNNKLLFRDIMNLRGFYFKDQQVKNLSPYQQESEILGGKPQSPLRIKLITELLQFIPEEQQTSETAIMNEVKRIIHAYEDVLEGIKHDEEFEHVKILGQSVSQNGAFNGLIGMVSVVFTAYQLIGI